jgi:hypothetical protein
MPVNLRIWLCVFSTSDQDVAGGSSKRGGLRGWGDTEQSAGLGGELWFGK